jgi:AcrR family transcriptional regulator
MGNTVQEILETARKILLTEGYETLTTQAIADRMDITDAGVHYHFETKEELLVGLIEDQTTTLEAQLGAYNGPPEKRLPALLEDRFEAVELLRDAELPPPSFQLLSATTGSEDRLRSALRVYMDTYVDMLEETIEHGVETGVFETESPERTARALTAMVEGAEVWAGLDESPESLVWATKHHILSDLYVGETPALNTGQDAKATQLPQQ